jgi:hypothetical protein
VAPKRKGDIMGKEVEPEIIYDNDNEPEENNEICSYCGEYTGPTNGLGMPRRHY